MKGHETFGRGNRRQLHHTGSPAEVAGTADTGMTTILRCLLSSPDQDFNGQFRSVGVKPLRSGLKIRTESGYLCVTAGRRIAGDSPQPFELPLLKILRQSELPADLILPCCDPSMEDRPEGECQYAGHPSAALRSERFERIQAPIFIRATFRSLRISKTRPAQSLNIQRRIFHRRGSLKIYRADQV